MIGTILVIGVGIAVNGLVIWGIVRMGSELVEDGHDVSGVA